ncbi:phage tail tape measure protein [Pseudomonas faucium]|uniref:phage tail tape measure protein n=1 Tax=Pseudomonas faucium TaxID=2740518 RepID=UPI0039C10688
MALKSRLELEVDGRSAEQQVNDIRAALEALEQAGVRASSTLRKSGGEFTNLAMSLAKVQAANDKTATATDTAAKSAESAAKAAATQRKELDALLGKIDPLTKKLNELAAQEAALAQARSSGQINTAAFDAYSLKLQDSLNTLAGVSRAQTAVGETAEQARQRILGIADAAVKAAQEQRNLANVATGLSEAEQGLLSGNMVLAANQGKLAQSSQKVAEANRQAQAAIGGQTDSLQELLASIDPTTRALSRLDEQERKLAQQKRIGALDAETFTHYQGKIDQARSALSSFDDGLNRTGNTAKQNAAALRMLPAQFSDIFISLQGGQAPLTVFLQQGSQIKDSFGGIGAAAKAMGGYVLSLVTPLSVVAAAGVALGYAFYKGSQEADRFNDSLVLTGGAAGLTSDQLGAMAKQVSAVVGSTGAAAAALAQISGSGKIAGESFQQVALAAVSMKEATGKAVSDTIAEFVKIADEPVKASAALNSQYHYLTGSVYSQIAALEEQGRHADAVKLATDAFADAINNRTPKIIENLSFWERGYNAVARAADRLKDIGRPNVDDDIAQAEADLARAQKGDVGFFQDKDKMVEFYTDQLNFLKDTKAAQEDLAQYDKEQAEANERTVKAMEYVDSAEKSARTNAEKRADALKKYEQSLDRIRAKNPDDPRLSADRVAKVKSNIAEQYKDPKTPKGPQYREDAGQKMLDNARQRYAVLQQQSLAISGELGQTQKLGAEARKLVELETEIANLKEKKTLTTSQKQILAMAEMNVAQQKQNAELERANELTKERFETEAKLRAFRENLQSQLSTAREGQAVELEGYGQGDKLRQRLQEDLKIRQEYQRELDKVTRDYNRISNPTANDTALYQGQTEALRSALSTRLSDQQAYYAQVDRLQSDWTVGASQAMNTYAEQAADVASQTRNLFSSAFGNMEDAVVNFVKTGKLSFKDFADGVIEDLIRIQVQQAAAGFLGTAFSFLSGGSAALGTGTMTGSSEVISRVGFSGGGYTGPGGVNEPAGIVHKGEVVWSQDDIRKFGGVAAVESLRNGSVNPASGGGTSSAGYQGQVSASSASLPPIINQIEIHGNPDADQLARMEDSVNRASNRAYQMMLSDLKRNGPAMQMIRGKR